MINQQILALVRSKFPQIAEKALQESIAEVGTLLSFKAGEVIQEPGGYIKLVPLVIEGSIKVSREDDDGNELFLYYINGGDTCSMSFTCCMMNKRSEIRTVAEENTTLIGVPIKYTDLWMTQYQSWKNLILQTYDHRMLELVRAIENIAFKKMDERLLDYLQLKSKTLNKKVLTATHQQIAYDLNASREAISRLLKQLEKQDLVKLGRNKIELR